MTASVAACFCRVLARCHAAASERGASMAEYGLLLALVALIAAFQVGHVGEHVKDTFESVAGAFG